MRKRILLIDDSMAIHKIVELILDNDSFELFRAYDSAEGLSVAREHDPHIALVDNNLCVDPSFLSTIASFPSHIGTVMLFGAYDKLPEVEITNFNAQDYLIKPFNANDFNNALTSLLNGGADIPSSEAMPPFAEDVTAVSEEFDQEIIETCETAEPELQTDDETADETANVIDDPLSIIEQDFEYEMLESQIKQVNDLLFKPDELSVETENSEANSDIVDVDLFEEDEEWKSGVKPSEYNSDDILKITVVDREEDLSQEPVSIPEVDLPSAEENGVISMEASEENTDDSNHEIASESALYALHNECTTSDISTEFELEEEKPLCPEITEDMLATLKESFLSDEEMPVEPAEDTLLEPAESISIEPAEDILLEPAEYIPMEPAEDISVELTEDMPVEPAEDISVELAEDMPVEPAEDILLEPVMPEEPAEDISVEPAEDISMEPMMPVEPAEDTLLEPAESISIEPAEDILLEPAEYTPMEPAEDISVELAEDMPVEPAEDISVEPAEYIPMEPAEDISVELAEDMPVEPSEDVLLEPVMPEEPAEDMLMELAEDGQPGPEIAQNDMVNALYDLFTDIQDEFSEEETPYLSEADKLREEISERQGLMDVFERLEGEYSADSSGSETVTDTVMSTGFRRIAELAGIDKKASVRNSGKGSHSEDAQDFVRAGRIVIDLSKEELADILTGTLNTPDVQNMVKDAMRYSLEQTMEKVVREKIEQIKGK
ncbi:MAG: hypothetical protein LBH05_03505 [Deferribacteraceae bacterium]|jgi:DNA-binding response OmpR family regulator|nr:hypothetical protein [Deferribacteraceae bacterium]